MQGQILIQDRRAVKKRGGQSGLNFILFCSAFSSGVVSGKKKKNPDLRVGINFKVRRRPTLPLYAVPSALAGLTSLFGMGRGGSLPL